MTRIYVVKEDNDGVHTARLVRAGNPAQAVRHVVNDRFEAEVASQDTLVKMLSAGGKVEEAGTDTPASD